MKKAIVTLTIGKKYENLFNTYCKNNWIKYCEKFNYDLIVINQSLDDSKRSKKGLLHGKNYLFFLKNGLIIMIKLFGLILMLL